VKKLKVVGILLVLVLLATITSAEVVSQSSNALTVKVTAPETLKTNGFNYVVIDFKNTASYPVSARVIVKPSYFAINPDWVRGVDAMKTGSGVTFTLFNIPAGETKTVKIVIPGDVVEGLKDEVAVIDKVEVYPFTGHAAQTMGVEAKNFNAMSIAVPQSFITYDDPLEAFFPLVLVVVGVLLAVVGAKYLQ
jgi:hypothetical protein